MEQKIHLTCSSCSLKPAPPLSSTSGHEPSCFWFPSPHLSSTVVWGQQWPVSRSQSVFHAETCSAAQLGRLAPVPTQPFPTSSQQPKVQPKRISLGMCEPASEPACHSATPRKDPRTFSWVFPGVCWVLSSQTCLYFN